MRDFKKATETDQYPFTELWGRFLPSSDYDLARVRLISGKTLGMIEFKHRLQKAMQKSATAPISIRRPPVNICRGADQGHLDTHLLTAQSPALVFWQCAANDS